MAEPAFSPFVLVGGTNLSLRHGHRKSVDIDMFTAAPYGSLDFDLLDSVLRQSFPYCKCPFISGPVSFGRSYYVGYSESECIKLDLMYTDTFLYPADVFGPLRLANEKDIIAMKIEAITTGGRKKDFWDLHYLLDRYSLDEMIELYQRRCPYGMSKSGILGNIMVMGTLDDDFDPECLLLKNWDEIKLDFLLEADRCIQAMTANQ